MYYNDIIIYLLYHYHINLSFNFGLHRRVFFLFTKYKMSSVFSVVKQISPDDQYIGVPNLSQLASQACEFVPASSNLNYPPGYVMAASAALRAAIQTVTVGYSQQVPVLRDMGKTIFAPTVTSSLVPTGNFASFRQVQLLLPQPIKYPQGFIGGVGGNAFGVVGGNPDLYTAYLTFYIPTVVGGVFSEPVNGTF
jgi:hypothetical protein